MLCSVPKEQVPGGVMGVRCTSYQHPYQSLYRRLRICKSIGGPRYNGHVGVFSAQWSWTKGQTDGWTTILNPGVGRPLLGPAIMMTKLLAKASLRGKEKHCLDMKLSFLQSITRTTNTIIKAPLITDPPPTGSTTLSKKFLRYNYFFLLFFFFYFFLTIFF